MVLDSSAVVALLVVEEGHERLYDAIELAPTLAIGAPNLMEVGMVTVGRYGETGRADVSRFLEDWSVEVVPFDERHWRVAIAAFARYGKGRHPARLNYGDCMAYATAKVAGAPLLFVGDDFAQTDVEVA